MKGERYLAGKWEEEKFVQSCRGGSKAKKTLEKPGVDKDL
jgi:hypothetical protein